MALVVIVSGYDRRLGVCPVVMSLPPAEWLVVDDVRILLLPFTSPL